MVPTNLQSAMVRAMMARRSRSSTVGRQTARVWGWGEVAVVGGGLFDDFTASPAKKQLAFSNAGCSAAQQQKRIASEHKHPLVRMQRASFRIAHRKGLTGLQSSQYARLYSNRRRGSCVPRPSVHAPRCSTTPLASSFLSSFPPRLLFSTQQPTKMPIPKHEYVSDVWRDGIFGSTSPHSSARRSGTYSV